MKNDKAPGNYTAEVVKNVGENGTKMPEFILKLGKREEYLRIFKISLTLPIFKEGDISE